MKTIATASNLANLLPTGTVLAFETLIPSLSGDGECHTANKGFSISVIIICALICFFSTFTDSFVDSTDGKLYYGIITRKGMHILNPGEKEITDDEKKRLEKYRIKPKDYLHAFVSLSLFMIFALTDLNVKNCFFPDAPEDLNQITIHHLPLAAGVFASFIFTVFPTTRRGIGYTQPRPDKIDKNSWNQNLATRATDLEMGFVPVGAEAEAKASITTANS
ncbi:protein DMP10-like [Argentina anserina]|uniref:protein DMP10-like n=1 Tax=Argentina anserina TaxID=57926 RepID=UPI0021763C09|nr:protein DMP10-like [Potentilla anserina]